MVRGMALFVKARAGVLWRAGRINGQLLTFAAGRGSASVLVGGRVLARAVHAVVGSGLMFYQPSCVASVHQ